MDDRVDPDGGIAQRACRDGGKLQRRPEQVQQLLAPDARERPGEHQQRQSQRDRNADQIPEERPPRKGLGSTVPRCAEQHDQRNRAEAEQQFTRLEGLFVPLEDQPEAVLVLAGAADLLQAAAGEVSQAVASDRQNCAGEPAQAGNRRNDDARQDWTRL